MAEFRADGRFKDCVDRPWVVFAAENEGDDPWAGMDCIYEDVVVLEAEAGWRRVQPVDGEGLPSAPSEWVRT